MLGRKGFGFLGWKCQVGIGAVAGLVCIPVLAQQKEEQKIIDNEEVVIGASDPAYSYRVNNNSRFLASQATIIRLVAVDSTVLLTEGTVVLKGASVESARELQVARSFVRNDGIVGLAILNVAKASISDSELTGLGAGLAADKSSAVLVNVKAIGRKDNDDNWLGWGLGVIGANVEVRSGSHILGDTYSVHITQPDFDPAKADSHLLVDASRLEALGGATIRVEGRDGFTHSAEIDIQNQSTLLTGNGNLLESLSNTTTQFRVDNSILTGHLVADDTSTLNVTLQNQARLTGNIVNGNELSIHSGGHWTMVDDNAIKSLTLDRGSVDFGGGDFKTLSLDHLTGSGTFAMRIDLDQGDGDLLDVQGQAYGQFGLRVRNTGTEVISPELEPLLLVHTEGGNAQFNLVGGRVDLGTYSYQLEQQGNDWFIVGENRTISPSTASALALFNAGPTIWMSELSTLRSRMGEVRTTGLGGGWMRSYGNRFQATTGDGIDYKQKQQGFSLGADAPVPVSNGQLSLGVMVGHSQSDLDLSAGTRGEVGSVYVGTYATWLSDQGYYLDAVLKLNRLRNKAKVAMSDSTKAKGDYDNTGFGGSVELGRHIKLADDWFVEPYAQLAAVTLKGERYRMDNGLQASNSQTRSILGKVGTSVGRDIALKDGGVLQPYVRVALAQEFSRHNDVRVNDSRFDNDLSGTRAEVGAGVSVSLSERLQLHADFDYMNGKQVKQPWGTNVGLRLAF